MIGPHSPGPVGARAGAGEAVRLQDEHDPFADDQAPFLHDHSDHQDERESFIDATADSYNHLASTNPRNPFADTNTQDRRLHDGMVPWDNRTATASGYDSFDSQDDGDDNNHHDGYDSNDSYDSDSDFSNSGDDQTLSGVRRNVHQSRTADYHSPTDIADEDDDGQEDTQRLLLSSTNTKLGGMGMGMRVGETGTGTMIGLDLEPHGSRGRGSLMKGRDDEYDTLPLSTVDVERLRNRDLPGDDGSKEGTGRRHRSHKGYKGRRKHRHGGNAGPGEHSGADGTTLGLGAIRAEQVAALAKRQLRVQMFWNVFYVFAWYSFSSALSFYNKWLFSPQHHNFQYPLFTTSLHMFAQFTLSSITLALLPALRPKAAPSAKDFGTKILPCAAASGLDIGLSNSSLKTITLAFYTMCKSSSLAFVLLFAFAFKLEKPTWSLVGVIAVICVGLFLMVMSEVDFVLVGFIQVMLASVLGGLRWSLTQLLLEKTSTKSGSLANPISTIFFLSPIMGICLCIVAGIFEGYGTIFSSPFFATPRVAFGTLGLLFLGGLFAFMMVLAEFNLIARTSVVSLSVLGIVKEVVTILISAAVFHDHLTLVNVLGLIVTLTGIGVYHFLKLREMKAKTRRAAKELAEAEAEKQKRKVERRDARRLARKEKRQSGGSGSASGGSGSGTGSKSMASSDDRTVVFGETEQPWNHSLASPAGITGVDKKDGLMHDGFILDDDDEDEDFAQHGIVNKR
ncbi:Triose-phosphate Transporter [Dissophora globulifera]|uniref:Triose-phosphate Transporter n=1 Tax=Dissophora globulifera TaxID=979702 RepID=A0A9P6RPR6_9FUNG|nr:Triose-phosphate Transporter [Dissophora globulifera]